MAYNVGRLHDHIRVVRAFGSKHCDGVFAFATMSVNAVPEIIPSSLEKSLIKLSPERDVSK